MGFDLRKYNAVEAYRFCDFLAKQFQIGSKVKKSVEGLPLIIIEGDDAIRLTRMIYPFLTYFEHKFKLGTGDWNPYEVVNRRPAVIPLVLRDKLEDIVRPKDLDLD